MKKINKLKGVYIVAIGIAMIVMGIMLGLIAESQDESKGVNQITIRYEIDKSDPLWWYNREYNKRYWDTILYINQHWNDYWFFEEERWDSASYHIWGIGDIPDIDTLVCISEEQNWWYGIKKTDLEVEYNVNYVVDSIVLVDTYFYSHPPQGGIINPCNTIGAMDSVYVDSFTGDTVGVWVLR